MDFVQGKYARNTTLYSNVAGLDQFSWGNVRPNKNDRYWAHLILAVIVVVYTCFVFFDELRGYIRLRQAYLTSPQHRLRASATTVLVTGIPRKWCTFEALDGLYDVFPGGIRNIWVNRNYDELNVKVKLRTKLADKLEAAQTTLIRNATVAYNKRAKMDAKKTKHTPSNDVELDLKKTAGERGVAMAEKPGLSSGNPHQVPHTVEEALADSPGQLPREQSLERPKPLVPIPVIGQGIETVGHGIDNIGKSVFKGLKQAGKNIDERLNTTGGFASDERRDDDDDQRTSDALENENNTVRKIHHDPDGSSDTIIRRSATQRRGLGPTSQGSQLLNDGVVAVDAGVFENTTDGKVHHAHDASYDKTVRREPTHDRGADSPTQGSQPLELPLQSGAHDFGMDGWYDDSRIRGGLAQRSTSKDFPRNNETKKQKSSVFKFWNRSEPFGIPSPTPHGKEDDEFPLSTRSPTTPGENPQAAINGKDSHKIGDPNRSSSSISCLPTFGRKRMRVDQEYPAAYNEEYNPDDDGEPEWKTYLKEKDRETMRLPICGWLWMPALPLIGKKVDTIDHCRKELARLNVEIEQDQRNPEKFPLMNSAFIQFNHQIAAHMACQSVSHHSPNAMAPRAVEISPDDVIWDNMSIKWWESYIRTAIVIALIIGLTIGWAFPVTFTGLLSQIQYLQATFKWLRWLRKAPIWVLSIIQGVLPQLLLTALIALLPVMLRLLAKSQGNYTGMAVEMSVQNYYFAFLFVQIFLVVSLSSGITTVLDKISKGPQSIPSILASDLPKASNYFFSYMILQALSVSAGALVQLMSLFKWFVLAPLLDSTARQKWARQTNLPDMQWGTFFPVYTNLAAIGEYILG